MQKMKSKTDGFRAIYYCTVNKLFFPLYDIDIRYHYFESSARTNNVTNHISFTLSRKHQFVFLSMQNDSPKNHDYADENMKVGSYQPLLTELQSKLEVSENNFIFQNEFFVRRRHTKLFMTYLTVTTRSSALMN